MSHSSKHRASVQGHSPLATNTTRGEPMNMLNRKPFRTKAQKEEARAVASKRSDGTWRSTADVSFHYRQGR